MLLFTSDGIFYSKAVIVLLTAAVIVLPALGALVLAAETCWLHERWLFLLDYGLAATLLSTVGAVFLRYNLCSPCNRPELYALRVASALVVCVSTLCAVVNLLPRPVLFAATVLGHALFLNVTSWCSALMLRLQTAGLASFLPAPIEALISTPPLVRQ